MCFNQVVNESINMDLPKCETVVARGNGMRSRLSGVGNSDWCPKDAIELPGCFGVFKLTACVVTSVLGD